MSVSGVFGFERESYKTQIPHFDLNCFVFFTTYIWYSRCDPGVRYYGEH